MTQLFWIWSSVQEGETGTNTLTHSLSMGILRQVMQRYGTGYLEVLLHYCKWGRIFD